VGTKGVVTKFIDKNLIDIFAVYCKDTDEVFYFDPKKFAKCVSLRVTPSKNKQKKTVNLANDFKQVPFY